MRFTPKNSASRTPIRILACLAFLLQGCATEKIVDSFGNYTVEVVNNTDLDLDFTYGFQTGNNQTNEISTQVRAHEIHPVNSNGIIVVVLDSERHRFTADCSDGLFENGCQVVLDSTSLEIGKRH